MRTAYFSNAPALQLLGVIAICAVAVACADSPVRPTTDRAIVTPQTASLSSAATMTASPPVTTGQPSAPVDLAVCLTGDNDPSCFDARAVGAAAVVGSPAVAPSAPYGVSYTYGPRYGVENTLGISWNASPIGYPFTSYIIEVGSGPGLVNLANFSTGNADTSYYTTGVIPGTYWLRVRAVNAAGTSEPSSDIIIVISASGCLISPPRSLVNTSQGPGNISLTWSAPVTGFFTMYHIEAGSAPGSSNLSSFDTQSTSQEFSANGIGAGAYYIRVYAKSSSCMSAASNEVVVVVTATPTPGSCASAPRSLVNASQSAGTISLTWSAPASGVPTSYVIAAGSAPGRSDLVSGSDTGSTATSYVATGVPAGSYYVRVYSRSSCGLSSASNEILVFVVGFSSDVQVSVSWDTPTDVDLHVVDPSGEEVYWGRTTSASGGQLDVDSNPACNIDGRQIENIRWSGRAPAGTYTVRVDYWNSCSVALTNYLVTVKNGGSTQTYSGNFTGSGDGGGAGSGRLITTFVHAASVTLDPVFDLIRPPSLSVPSTEKLRLSKGTR